MFVEFDSVILGLEIYPTEIIWIPYEDYIINMFISVICNMENLETK